MMTKEKNTKRPLPVKGQLIAAAIESIGLKQYEFASIMGLPPDSGPSTVNNWLRRGRIPADQSFKAGRILGRNPEWLTTDDPNVPEFPQDVETIPPRALRLALAIAALPPDLYAHFEAILLAQNQRR